MGELLYFFLGSLSEALIVVYYRFIQQRRVLCVSLLGMLITALNLFVIAEIVVSKRIVLVLAFILGQGAGAVIALKIK